MKNKYISLKEDIIRLIRIFEAETDNGIDKQLTIYSSDDKKLPPNSIVYYHPETVKQLETEGILKITKPGNHIDETAPYFAGPPYYEVVVFYQKVKEKIATMNTVSKQPPKPLPKGVEWTETKEQFKLTFPDNKFLEFNDIEEESAKYFRLLVINHGLPVDHKSTINAISAISNNNQVRNLVKTLKEKIYNNRLKNRIEIKSFFKSSYTLTITS